MFFRRAASLGRTVLLPLAFCVLASFSLPCGLVLDGHGNMGDETMTIALASDISFASLPGYGYESDGQRWTWGVNTAPLYGWFYAVAVHAAPPLRRIEAARLVSRTLGGAAIYLITLSLLQLVFRRTPGTAPLRAQLTLAFCVAFAFMNSPRFRFIVSFARVEALGFFFLAAVLAAGPRLIARPSRRSVFLFTLLSLSVGWTSYIAFYLSAFISAFCLAAGAIASMKRGPAGGWIRSLLIVWVVPVGCALATFYALSFLLQGALLAGPAAAGLSRMISTIMLLAHTPSHSSSTMVSTRPELLWFLAGSGCGLVFLLVRGYVTRRGRGPNAAGQPSSATSGMVSFAWAGLALLVTAVLYQLWLVTLAPVRFTYDILITTAFAFLQLIVFCFILRDRAVERRVMAIATVAALLFASLYPAAQPLFLCTEDASRKTARLWPLERTVAAGFYNPFNDSSDNWNRARRLHVEAARNYLQQRGVPSVLATDPMFAEMSDAALRFYFINNSLRSTGSPAAETQLLAVFVSQQDMRYIVSTDFGVSPLMDGAGFTDLRHCLRQAVGEVSVCRLGGQSVEMKRVFRTDEILRTADVYAYGTANSTPISIYLLTVL